jgi:predicted molibdopterin-dependent oxidoreductase YjgC
MNIFAELAVYLGKPIPVFSAEQVMEEIAEIVPAYADCRYEVLPAEGRRVAQSGARLQVVPMAEGAAVL